MFAKTRSKRIIRSAQAFLLIMITGLFCGRLSGQVESASSDGQMQNASLQLRVAPKPAALSDASSWSRRYDFDVTLFPEGLRSGDANNFRMGRARATGQSLFFVTTSLSSAPQRVRAFGLSATSAAKGDPVWNGGVGNWSNSAKWTGGVPTATTDASIDGGKAIASPVTLDISGAQVRNLTIDPDDSLTFPNGASLTVNGTSISNAGHISLNSSGATTQLIISGAASLSGAGTLTMSDNANNLINNSAFGGSSFTNQSTIQGAGEIRDGNNSMKNSGTIDATSTMRNQLSITGNGAVTNTGTLEATGGGTLNLSGTAIANAGGTISAGSGSQVLLVNATINGGTLITSGSGAIQSNCCLQASTLNGVTNNGTFQVGNQSSAYLEGTVTNNGSIQVNATGTGTSSSLGMSGAVILKGTGTVTMSDNADNRLSVQNGGATLTNQSTIQGAGTIAVGSSGNSITNQGTISATSAKGNQLVINPSGTFTNNGKLQAINGGTLNLQNTFNNASGIISAGNGANVLLVNATINGGTLATSGSGAIQSNCCLQASTLNGVTNSGTFQVGNQSSAYLEGTVTNNGSIQVNATGTGTSSSLGMSGAVILKGTGTVTMSDNPDNSLSVQSGGASLTNQSTIQGAGTIAVGSSGNSITNQGTISATSAKGNQLVINPSGTFTNNGKLQAINGGTLNLQNTFNNASGIISAGNGANVLLVNATINGGTLATSGSGAIQSNCCLQASILNGVTNNGTFQVGNQSAASLKGTITNNGSIQVNATGTGTSSSLAMIGGVTLKGSGTVTMSDNPDNSLSVQSGGASLMNQSTIQGAGTINLGNNNMTNQGTVAATGTNSLLLTGSGTLTNQGTLSTKAGSLMHISSLFGNFAGSTLTGGTYNLGGILQIDALGNTAGEIVTNAANIILNASTSNFLDAAGKNALANLNINASTASFTITGGRNFTTAGNFTNNGTLTVGASNSTFHVNGNLTNFTGTTLTGGTYNLTGTLEFNGANIVTNAANITLTGTSSQIINQASANGLAKFAANASTGKFTVAGGRVLTTTGAFTNSGSFTTTGTGSKFTAGGNFGNLGSLTVSGSDSETATISTAAFSNSGTLTVGSGSTFTTGGSLTNFSGTTLTAGTYNITGTFQFKNANIMTNAANITLTGSSSKIVNQSGVNGIANFTKNAASGSLTIAGGRVFAPGGAFTNAGILTITGTGSKFTSTTNLTNTGAFSIGTGAALTLSGAGIFAQTAGKTTDDGTLTAASVALNGGNLFGTGSIVGPMQSSGTVTPADSLTKAGSLAVTGNYTQNSTGALDIAIGGTTAGTSYDQLKVSRTALVNGTLNLSRLNGFVPTMGTQFVILTGNSVSGQFTKVTGTAINASEHFVVLCDTTDCDVKVVSGAAASGASAVTSLATSRAFWSGVEELGIERGGANGSAAETITQSWRQVALRGSSIAANQASGKPTLRSSPLYLHDVMKFQAITGAENNLQAIRFAVAPNVLRPSEKLSFPTMSGFGHEMRARSMPGLRSANISGNGRGLLARPRGRGMVGQRGVAYQVDVLSLLKTNPGHIGRILLSQPGASNASAFGFVVAR